MRRYNATAENFSVGTGNVLFAVRTAADGLTAGGKLAIRRVEITQNATATGAQVRGAFSTRDTVGTLTMTSNTPAPTSPVTGPASGITGSTAPAGTAARCGTNSSADSGGTYVNHRHFNFNNLNGYLWVATPQDEIIVPPAVVWCVRFLASPGTTTGWTISVDYEELS